ncbi:MAG: zinc ribbon domain-containing protein [Candidatus Bipolaricaulota bacterium]|nr:zinc ribbon domain-containing protein [Candidatus Bipolaricaulota bacterium]
MRRIAIALLVASVLGSAQQPLVMLEHLAISLWPEYDDPRLLVIYRGELAQDPPGPLLLTLPRTAHVHAVAYVGSGGRLLTADWQLLPSENSEKILLFTPRTRLFQLEYYDDVLGTAPEREFVFRFFSDRYDVKNLEIEVQQPLRAKDFQGSPALEPQGTDVRGFSYFGRRVGSVPTGTVIEQRVSYRKTDNEPSLRPAGIPWIPIAVGGAGLALIAVVSLVWLRRRRLAPSGARTHFCARCGYRFRADEQFCPQCGQRRAL